MQIHFSFGRPSRLLLKRIENTYQKTLRSLSLTKQIFKNLIQQSLLFQSSVFQDSLGGNTKTLMVACLSPADNNYDETLSTLRYANRAKNIKNKPKINEDPKDAMLREFQEEIQKLKEMLEKQPQGGAPGKFFYY